MDYSVHRSFGFIPTLVAITMIVAGLLTIQFRINTADDVGLGPYARVLSGFLLLGFGGMILMPRFNNMMGAIGLMCLGIGFSNFTKALSYSFKSSHELTINGVLNEVMWVLSYITLFFSVYMIYRGTNFMRMDAMNAFIMRFSSMGIVIAYLLALIYAHELADVPIEYLWENHRQFILTPTMYVFYFLLLCTKEVYDKMYWEVVRTSIMEIAGRLNPGTMVTHKEKAEEFFRRSKSPRVWKKTMEGSPIDRELRLEVSTEGPSMQVLLERWVDTGKIYYSLVPSENGAYIAAQRGEVKDIEYDGSVLRIYNEKHLAMQIEIIGGTADGDDAFASFEEDQGDHREFIDTEAEVE